MSLGCSAMIRLARIIVVSYSSDFAAELHRQFRPKGAVAPGSVKSAASAANRYCAKPAEATAPPECSYLSMKDCRASLKGKAGNCYKF
jgi:hypothetical protein